MSVYKIGFYNQLDILKLIETYNCQIKIIGVNSPSTAVNKLTLSMSLAINDYIKENSNQIQKLFGFGNNWSQSLNKYEMINE